MTNTSPALTTSGVSIPVVGARFGVKGSDAPAWLQQLGLAIPVRPNSVMHWQLNDPFGSGRCLRQGSTEFLIELDTAAMPVLPANPSLRNAWVLDRGDQSLVLNGTHWPRTLAKLCSFDFIRLHDEPDLVIMTLLAGIGVTLIREPASGDALSLRLWCDASFSVYLRQCLHSIGESR